MYNPLEDPVPESPLLRVDAFVKDLAYGATEGLWPSEFVVAQFDHEEWMAIDGSGNFVNLFKPKWHDKFPSSSLLYSQGYLTERKRRQQEVTYALTPKAFLLLKQTAPASIFISYRRDQSSAFAQLFFSRMKAKGLSPFLDTQLEPGDEWHARLESEIAQREYCIVLVSPTTLDSQYVRREILWALDGNKKIIPIWHNGMNGEIAQAVQEQYPKLAPFFTKQAIIVDPESPAGYEAALIQLFNRFGYTP